MIRDIIGSASIDADYGLYNFACTGAFRKINKIASTRNFTNDGSAGMPEIDISRVMRTGPDNSPAWTSAVMCMTY
jgi:hypothetical protein